MELSEARWKCLCEWRKKWKKVGILNSAAKCAPTDVGLYRAKLEGEIVYVGAATEYTNRGLRKRLTDYIRESNSARQNEAGKRMNEHADYLEIELLITGSDSSAAELARRLEHGFIFVYQPRWNFLPQRQRSA